MKASTIILVVLIAIISGCSGPNSSSPIPRSHPAHGFHQIAKSGPTTIEVCKSYGGIEIFPSDYTVTKHLAQGVFNIKQHSTDKEFFCVSFGEGEIVVTVKTCCWVIE